MSKELATKQLTVMVQPGLFKTFESKCLEEHRMVSEVIRELMSRYAQGWVQTPLISSEVVKDRYNDVSEL